MWITPGMMISLISKYYLKIRGAYDKILIYNSLLLKDGTVAIFPITLPYERRKYVN